MSYQRIRTLVVDDSVFYRGILADTITNLNNAEYLGFASNGKHALAKIAELKPDLITLDVEMPGMTGIEVLRRIKEHYPDIQVVMVSATTEESAEHTLEALKQGALDFIQKPQGDDQQSNERQLYRELRRILNIVETKVILKRGKGIDPRVIAPKQQPLNSSGDDAWSTCENTIKLVVIGVSTGGPQALPQVLSRLPKSFNLPVVIIQHLPALFVSVLVKSLNQSSQLKVVEIEDNQILQPGVVYVAPGGVHTKLIRDSGQPQPVTRLTLDPPENFCRPSVDYFFRSVAEIYRGNVLAVIMTGMGKDGTAGMKMLKSQGASTIAQNEETSVVFGMPLEAINAGVVDKVVALDKIAYTIAARIGLGDSNK